MNKSTKQGFTIIEVVLVLAIAALIFLMAFVAFPALQRTQKDTARKNAMSTVVSAVNNYVSNNRGNLSELDSAALTSNYAKEINDAGYTIEVRAVTTPVTLPNTDKVPDKIIVYKSGKCSATIGSVDKGSARQFAVFTYLETAKNFVCQEG